ncbi:MAG: hypothetical protein HFH61_02375 [Lachnospiraceae bacterium]|nr:hypothetical protein [Lachnospiraceae bacterium]
MEIPLCGIGTLYEKAGTFMTGRGRWGAPRPPGETACCPAVLSSYKRSLMIPEIYANRDRAGSLQQRSSFPFLHKGGQQ